MRYASAKSAQAQEEKSYRVYVTDVLKDIIGASNRYLDWIDRKPVDNRTGEEIDRELSEKFGWK